MGRIDEFLAEKLAARKTQNAFRELQLPNGLIDFCSNDYLGLARLNLKNSAASLAAPSWGATGSRLISGHSQRAEQLELFLAQFHQTEAALLFNSGYQANVGLLSCLSTRHDTIVYDQLIHASLRDGIQLSPAKAFNFAHNDIEDLARKLERAKGQKIVVIESIYSMDGDEAPIADILSVCEKFEAQLIVDEAHATGVFGPAGEGVVVARGLQDQVWARIHTFGKAVGAHGAVVVGSQLLKHYLINFSRAFIYTTALPDHLLQRIQLAYEAIRKGNKTRELSKTITQFRSQLNPEALLHFTDSQSPIQCLILGGNSQTKDFSELLQKAGFDVRAILSPTVASGKERLRICLHTFNTVEEITALTGLINKNIAVYAEGNLC